MDAMCGRLHPQPVTTRHFVVGTNGGLANVFVYLQDRFRGKTFRQLIWSRCSTSRLHV